MLFGDIDGAGLAFFQGFVGEGCEGGGGGAGGEVGSVDEGLVLVGGDDEDDYTAGAVGEDWLAGGCHAGGVRKWWW
jgi:hypothetical protein